MVDFWEDDLELVDGRFAVRGDSAQENTGTEAINPVSTLGYIRAAIKLALSMSDVLNVDKECHERWRDILDHLSPFPVNTVMPFSIKALRPTGFMTNLLMDF